LRKLLQRFVGTRAVQIPDALWEAQLHRFGPLAGLDAHQRARLRELCAQFLAVKSMTGAAGLALDAQMELHIAAQACLPVLGLGLDWYRGWNGIVVYPARFRVRRRVQEDNGLEHEMDDELAGEAWDGGPVVLSWHDSAPPGTGTGPGADERALPGNVVIHEFAHTIDLLDGIADGIPPLDRRLHAGLDRAQWAAVLDDAFERFCAGLDMAESDIPGDVDPESAAAERYYAHLPIDPYAATDPAEFFAVSSEALFTAPLPLRDAFPQWHALLSRFYRLDGR